MDDWIPDKVMIYRYASHYAEIVFSVPGMSDWDEDRWDDASMDDLRSYVTTPIDYFLDDCWEDTEENAVQNILERWKNG